MWWVAARRRLGRVRPGLARRGLPSVGDGPLDRAGACGEDAGDTDGPWEYDPWDNAPAGLPDADRETFTGGTLVYEPLPC